MPGPAPKPDSERRRRNKLPTATRLPSEGRKGETPDWPLSRATVAENRVWAELWSTPQAVAWERLGWERTVARYCRIVVKAERPSATGVQLQEARQLEDRLGLTPMSILRLRWEIVEDELAQQRGSKGPDVRRLSAVDPAAAGD